MKSKRRNKNIGIITVIAIIIVLTYASVHVVNTSNDSGPTTETNPTCNFLCKLLRPTQQTYSTYFYDNELGIMKLDYSKGSKGITQTYFSQPAQITLGSSGRINQDFSAFKLFTIQKAVLIIKKDGSIYSTQDITSSASKFNLVTVTFTPKSVGKYTAEINAVFCRTSGTSGYCEASILTATDTLTVSSPAQACTKTPYFGSWVKVRDISGGVIEERTFYNIDSNTPCNFISYSNEDRTLCNSGYKISGTNSIVGNGDLVCEKIVVAEPTASGCNAPVTEACSDGTTVEKMSCSSNILTATGNSCTQTIIPECPTGTTGTYPNCVTTETPQTTNTTGNTGTGSVINIPQTGTGTGSVITVDTNLKSLIPAWQTYVLWGLIGTLVAIVGYISYNLIRSKK